MTTLRVWHNGHYMTGAKTHQVCSVVWMSMVSVLGLSRLLEVFLFPENGKNVGLMHDDVLATLKRTGHPH